MIDYCDVQGKIINKGDIVCFGDDNGSTLRIGRVMKLTPKFAVMEYRALDYLKNMTTFTSRRYHDRVCVVQ